MSNAYIDVSSGALQLTPLAHETSVSLVAHCLIWAQPPCGRLMPTPVTRPRAAGKAGALMAGLAVRETVTLRGGRSALLGPGHPCGDVAALLVDELFVN